VPAPDVRRTIEAVWRIESARLIAGLARIVRDVGVAEDPAQDALIADPATIVGSLQIGCRRHHGRFVRRPDRGARRASLVQVFTTPSAASSGIALGP